MFLIFENMKMFGFRPCKIFGLCFILVFYKCVVFWPEVILGQLQAYLCIDCAGKSVH